MLHINVRVFLCVRAGEVFRPAETNMSQFCFHLPWDLNPDTSIFVHDYHALWDPSRHSGLTVSSQQRLWLMSKSLICFFNGDGECKLFLWYDVNMLLVSVLPLNKRCQLLWAASLIWLMSRKHVFFSRAETVWQLISQSGSRLMTKCQCDEPGKSQ